MESKSNFKDHFSSHAKLYARNRPDYPQELFSYLNEITPDKSTVWDCATGSGQAALSLCNYFEQVIATDASRNQLRNAVQHAKIDYRVASAESSGIEDHSIDLITIAQALHWFDHDKFYEEVRRVSKPETMIAAWSYGITQIEPKIDQILLNYYENIVGPYWPSERHFIEDQYKNIPFPFQQLKNPSFAMKKIWNADDLLAYLRTWSATQKYIMDKGIDPTSIIEKPLKRIYQEERMVMWPIYLLAAKVN